MSATRAVPSAKPSAHVVQVAARTSSIFDLDQLRNNKPFVSGTSTTSFAYEPYHDDKLIATKRPIYEPTYRLESKYKFTPSMVSPILRCVLEEHLRDKAYSPEFAAERAKLLSTEIQKKVKRLKFDRCKLIVQVSIGQKLGQTADFSSRCCWDKDNDSFASAIYETSTLYAVAIVFGIYFE